jgi:hypothetical protein
MSVKRFIFNLIMAALFCLTAILGSIIIDGIVVGILAIIEILAVITLFVPFAGTFLFRVTGFDSLGNATALDVFLADGWLHKIITFVVINAIVSGLAGLFFSIPVDVRIILGLGLFLFVITLSIKVDNAKGYYGEAKELFSDFIPTILALGLGCYALICFTGAPIVIGIILLCLTGAVYVVRTILAFTKW